MRGEYILYNTCPVEYDKKFSKILKNVIKPALKMGLTVSCEEKEEIRGHAILSCWSINDKRRFNGDRRKTKVMAKCKGCIFGKFDFFRKPKEGHGRKYSTMTVKVVIQ